MRELSDAEQKILDSVDEQIDKVDHKLKPFQELIEQKQRLTKVKATLLNERVGSSRSSSSGYAQLTHEQVTKAFQDATSRYLSVAELAQATGAPDSTVRSHLNRGRDSMYKKRSSDNAWRIIGEESET